MCVCVLIVHDIIAYRCYILAGRYLLSSLNYDVVAILSGHVNSRRKSPEEIRIPSSPAGCLSRSECVFGSLTAVFIWSQPLLFFVVLVDRILCYQKSEVLLFNISNDEISHYTNMRSF